MSTAEKRAAIVAALNSVPEWSAFGFTPAPILPGSAWVVRTRTERLTFCIGVGTWFVFVGLVAATNQAAVDMADDYTDAGLEALAPVGKVTAVEPWSWPLETGQATIPVLRFSLEA